tara:strand:- start:2579 stop:3022 length:444 start_codon:yes stop_codon:yes gene_type:complete
MNIEKITYKIVKDSIKEDDSCTDFVLKMILSYLSDEQRGTVMDEIVNEREHILFKKADLVWFDPKDNKYDLKDLCQEDMMKDAKLMDEHGHIKGRIIKDTNYRDECSPYASEYIIHACLRIKDDGDTEYKEVRVRRSNIIGLWKPLE